MPDSRSIATNANTTSNASAPASPRRARPSLTTFLQGLWVGGTMTVPGVSGGSMAIVIGCYDQLIAAVSHIFKQPKASLAFLLTFGAGASLGIVTIAKLMSDILLAHFDMATRWFFVGAVIGGLPLVWRESNIARFHWRHALFLCLGLALVFLAARLPDGLFSLGAGGLSGLILQIAGGFVVALALVLPGVSTSQTLLMLGLYEDLAHRLSNLDFLPLLPFALSLLAATFLVSRTLERLLARHPQATYLTILGFVIGSIADLFPGLPSNSRALAIATAATALGFALIFGLSRLEQHKTNPRPTNRAAP